MSEIEKMYEKAGIKPDCTYLFLVDGNGENEAARTIAIGSKSDLKRLIVDCGVKGRVIKSTNTLKPFYSPFTAEKQIELIKWLAGFYVHINNEGEVINISTGCGYVSYYAENLADAIALCINSKWNNLTEEEKQQVKGILE